MPGPNVEPQGPVILHRGWEVLTRTRQEANRAVNAIIVASRVADRAIAAVDNQGRYLPEVYPGDEAAFEPFNYRLSATRSHIRDARGTLSGILLPYAVAIYNDYVIDCVAIALLAGHAPPAAKLIPGLAALHEWLDSALGIDLSPTPQMVLFDVVRQLRNRAVHGGGSADQDLVDARERLRAEASEAEADWARVARSPLPTYAMGEPIELGELDGRAMLYAAGNIARELNWQLWQKLPRDLAADLVVADYRTRRAPPAWSHGARAAGVAAVARTAYAPLCFTAEECALAIARSGSKAPPQMAQVLSDLDAAAAIGNSAARKRADMARTLFKFAPTTEAWL